MPNSVNRTLQILVIVAGLHLICVVLHQMLTFQQEFPHLIDGKALLLGSNTLIGSGALLWVFHPLLAALMEISGDLVLPTPLSFIFDSLIWAALLLALIRVICCLDLRPPSRTLFPS
jgi:hypothetical protein